MAFNPFAPIPAGVSDTTQMNAVIAGVNAFFTGLGQSGSAASSAGLTVTTTPTDVPSCTKTVTVVGNNAFAEVEAVFDFGNDATGTTNVAIGTLVVAGATQTAEAHMVLTANVRASVAQTYTIPLPLGSTTLKLQAAKNGGASTCTCFGTHTVLTVTVFDIP